jgi:hypothetical protein
MLIEMTKNDLTTLDNFRLYLFQKDKLYNVRESCGTRLIARGSAISPTRSLGIGESIIDPELEVNDDANKN